MRNVSESVPNPEKNFRSLLLGEHLAEAVKTSFSDFKLAKHGKIGMEQIRKAYNKWITEHLMGCGTPFKGHENRQQLVSSHSFRPHIRRIPD